MNHLRRRTRFAALLMLAAAICAAIGCSATQALQAGDADARALIGDYVIAQSAADGNPRHEQFLREYDRWTRQGSDWRSYAAFAQPYWDYSLSDPTVGVAVDIGEATSDDLAAWRGNITRRVGPGPADLWTPEGGKQ